MHWQSEFHSLRFLLEKIPTFDMGKILPFIYGKSYPKLLFHATNFVAFFSESHKYHIA